MRKYNKNKSEKQKRECNRRHAMNIIEHQPQYIHTHTHLVQRKFAKTNQFKCKNKIKK